MSKERANGDNLHCRLVRQMVAIIERQREDMMNDRIGDKLQCLIGALETIADFGKVCLGPGCPYCEQEGDPESLHPPSWEAKEAQRALELAGIRYSANPSHHAEPRFGGDSVDGVVGPSE